MLKPFAALGWLCFALDAVFVLMLLASRDAGSDAAGRGLSRGWGLVLLPFLLGAGGLLYWSSRSGSKVGTIAATLLVALPFILLANGKLKQARENSAYRAQLALNGRFSDNALNAIVKLIDAGDTTALRSMMVANKASGNSLNYQLRDAAGETLLGFAVTRASDYPGTMDKIASLRILLESGVPYAADAKEVNGDWARDLMMTESDRSTELVAMALDAGANANAVDKYDGLPVILNDQVKVPKLRLLVQHGANVHALKKDGHSALMNAVYFKLFPEALFFLQQGVDPNYVAPDGKSARTELDTVIKEYALNSRPMEAGYDEFAAALAAIDSRAKKE